MSRFRAIQVSRLLLGEGARLKAIRLRSLEESPDAYGATLAETLKFSAEEWEKNLADIPAFVASIDGGDVGLVRGVQHADLPEVAYLISMWVAPEARRRGVAAALTEALIDWANALGYQEIYLDVAHRNAAAVACYEHLGFVATGETDAMAPPREHITTFRMVKRRD